MDGFLEPAAASGRKGLAAEHGARCGQPGITARSGRRRQPKCFSLPYLAALRATVFSPVDNWRSGGLRWTTIRMAFTGHFSTHASRPLATRLRDAWRPSCPTSNSTPGSGRCRRRRRRPTAHGASSRSACRTASSSTGSGNQYAGRIETVLSELAGKPVRLDVTLAQRDERRRARRWRRLAAAQRLAASDAAHARRADSPAGARRPRYERQRRRGRQRRAQRAGIAAAVAQPAQPGAHLRHAGSRPRQPDGAHRRAARRRRRPASCTTRSSSTAGSASARRT